MRATSGSTGRGSAIDGDEGTDTAGRGAGTTPAPTRRPSPSEKAKDLLAPVFRWHVNLEGDVEFEDPTSKCNRAEARAEAGSERAG